MINENHYILPQDLRSGRAVKELVNISCLSNICVLTEEASKPEEYQRATLVIACGDATHAATVLDENKVPEHTPILILGTDDRPPNAVVGQDSARLTDYLSVPVSAELLLHRISLLTQVQRLAAEHYANTTTLSQQLNLLYTRDGLTGLYNRRHLTIQLSDILATAREKGDELSLLILNIDNFSDINNASGLDFGDFILNEIAVRLTRALRGRDSCYRYSGEEFIVIFPQADLDYTTKVADRLSTACSEKPFSDGSNTVSITVSIGVSSLQPHKPDTPDKFIFMAENALFEAKAEGRNQIRIYSPQYNESNLSQRNPLAFLKDKLDRILNTTRTTAISSLEMLAKNVAGSEHKTHIASVSNYISLLGSHLGLPDKNIKTFHNAVTLYNCFRALLHNDILSKPARLTTEERKIFEDLPFKLAEISDMFDHFGDERSLLLSFNERYDGTGYPDGLKGDEIPLGSRIFHIVDAVAAMDAERPFRRKLLPQEIINELKRGAGTQFDPFLLLQILTVIEKNGLIDIDPGFLIQTRQDIMKSFTQHRP
ncbi:MAG: diguanylate cyclase [Desulforhopalus sp.]